MLIRKQRLIAEIRRLVPPMAGKHSHRMEPVKVGKHTVLASGGMFLWPQDMDPRLLHVQLTRHIDYMPGLCYRIMPIILRDMGGVPANWPEIMELLVTHLGDSTPMHVFCDGGHGRTGCVLGSLIALIESARAVPDPIATLRARYCSHAVETQAQGEAIFALRGQRLPDRYVEQFEEQRRRHFEMLAARRATAHEAR